MTDEELKCVAVGIVVYQNIIDSGKIPNPEESGFRLEADIEKNLMESVLAVCAKIDMSRFNCEYEETECSDCDYEC